MQEIGSEFWNAPLSRKTNGLFLENTQWFLSGRSALKSIIRECKDCHSVAMPSWCCQSMIEPFLEAGIQVNFYTVCLKAGRLVIEVSFDSDILFVLDYFGYTTSDLDLSSYSGIIIRDVTHSIFSRSYQDADFYFGSLRKWCGVKTGGFAWSADGRKLYNGFPDDQYYSKRAMAMNLKMQFLNGVGDKIYLKMFQEAEDYLDSADICMAQEDDIYIANHLDDGFIRETRRENATILREAFQEWLVFSKMNDNDCPLFVPIIVPEGKRNGLRSYLVENRIYCPIHWPLSNEHCIDDACREIYENEMSLVCDQRYNERDMNRMVQSIRKYLEEKQ